MTKIVPSGLIVGIAIGWLGSVTFRSVWDGISPFTLFEWWASLVLLGCTLCLAWSQLSDPFHPLPKSGFKNLKESLLFGATSLLGVVLVLGWNIQYLQNRTVSNMATISHDVFSKSEVISLATQDCAMAKKFLLSIKNNTMWSLSIFDKHLIKQEALKWHSRECLSDDQIFSIVKDLRFRPTSPLNTGSSSALYDYHFLTNNPQALEQDLAVYSQQWCVQKKNPKKLCESLPNDILLSPSDYDTLLKKWKQTQTSLK